MCEESFKCSYMLWLPLYGKYRTKVEYNQICPFVTLILFPKLRENILIKFGTEIVKRLLLG
jgi:hypothetical protein